MKKKRNGTTCQISDQSLRFYTPMRAEPVPVYLCRLSKTQSPLQSVLSTDPRCWKSIVALITIKGALSMLHRLAISNPYVSTLSFLQMPNFAWKHPQKIPQSVSPFYVKAVDLIPHSNVALVHLQLSDLLTFPLPGKIISKLSTKKDKIYRIMPSQLSWSHLSHKFLSSVCMIRLM